MYISLYVFFYALIALKYLRLVLLIHEMMRNIFIFTLAPEHLTINYKQ